MSLEDQLADIDRSISLHKSDIAALAKKREVLQLTGACSVPELARELLAILDEHPIHDPALTVAARRLYAAVYGKVPYAG